MQYRPDQPAAIVHAELKNCVAQLSQLEDNLVRWYGDMKRRKLYREFGYSTMTNYAMAELDFSPTRASDLSTLVDRLGKLPELREAVESGEIGYTKARAAARVASPKTDAHWRKEATSSTRDELERKARAARQRGRKRRQDAAAGQPELLPEVGSAAEVDNRVADAVLCRVSLDFTAEQKLLYDELWNQLGHPPRAEDVLRALGMLVAREKTQPGGDTDCEATPTSPPGGTVSARVMIHTVQCPDCQAMSSMTGDPIAPATAERLQCDGILANPGRRNTSTIPPRIRQQVLERDHHQCRAAGCRHTLFLEVHHRIPRSRGGTNHPDNLVTLCRGCHQLVHENGKLPLKNPAGRSMAGLEAGGASTCRDRLATSTRIWRAPLPMIIPNNREPAGLGLS